MTAAFSGEPSEPRVEWFVDDLSRDDEPRSSVALEERSPGSWSATLPAQPEGTVLRARVLADLGRGEEPASPREGDPQSWHGRYVGTEPTGATRAFHLFIDPVRWTELWDLVRPGRVVGCEENPGWQARVPAVFVHEGRAVDVRVRYQGSRWNRTNGPDLRTWSAPGPERPSPPKSLSWSVKLPRYDKLDGHTRFSFNKLTQGCPGLTAQVGFQLFAAAGLPAPETRFARLFLNGAYYSYTLQIESPGEDMLERWLEARADVDPSLEEEPGVPHLFKSSGCNCDEGPFGWGDERPLGDHCGLSALDRYASTYERKTWSWDDHTALRDLIEGLDAARSGSDEGLRSFLEANFDVELVLAYMAVMNWAVPFDDVPALPPAAPVRPTLDDGALGPRPELRGMEGRWGLAVHGCGRRSRQPVGVVQPDQDSVPARVPPRVRRDAVRLQRVDPASRCRQPAGRRDRGAVGPRGDRCSPCWGCLRCLRQCGGLPPVRPRSARCRGQCGGFGRVPGGALRGGRHGGQFPSAATQATPRVYRRPMATLLDLGTCRVDLAAGEVAWPDRTVSLTEVEVRLLTYLAQHVGEALSRAELLQEVWGYSPKVRSRAVDQTLKRLRPKLERIPRTPPTCERRGGGLPPLPSGSRRRGPRGRHPRPGAAASGQTRGRDDALAALTARLAPGGPTP